MNKLIYYTPEDKEFNQDPPVSFHSSSKKYILLTSLLCLSLLCPFKLGEKKNQQKIYFTESISGSMLGT